MSSDIKLTWEWPADREIENRLLVTITDVKKEGGGIFGVKNSPSLVGGFPDPVNVRGVVSSKGNDLDGKSFEMVLPKLEISGLKKGSYAVLGILEDTVCVCIQEVDSLEVDVQSVQCLK